MKALRSFTVRPVLPASLQALHDLAMNLRWSWDERTRNLFRWVDPEVWEEVGHDPVRLLGLVSRDRLEALADDATFCGFMAEVHEDLTRYMSQPRWFQSREGSALRNVAYFSPEFGISEALPQYSGGLGVLAGDHLKAASGLGVPLVGVGLFYRQGYFQQQLSSDGWQQERYPTLDPFGMAMEPQAVDAIEVDLAGRTLRATVWKVAVGRIQLFLLDADREDNEPDLRLVTDRLYGGETEHRMQQEILLGVGGVRALQAVGIDTQVFHTNEGHAGFLGLERIRQLVVDAKLPFDDALEAARAGTLFTTHTPVPAGIDRFPVELMKKYFSAWSDQCGISFEQLLGLGRVEGDLPDAPFNMAVMGLRLAGMSNAVSALHGSVSRRMFAPVWPGVPDDEVPIGHVTNGVHARTWISAEMDDLFTRSILPDWNEASPTDWERLMDVRDDEIWRIRETQRSNLVEVVRARTRTAHRVRGTSSSELDWLDELLDPRVLTIGFARRFASYKRATLLLSQQERLEALLLDAQRPVQFIFAGKAHPADETGKEMIRELVQFTADPRIRHRFAFVENYDIALARAMYRGCDVWLNNPRRPEEACGTSGEKAALNGALNLSIADGWWDEMFDGENGWTIASAEAYTDLEQRDKVEADSLFDLLERKVVPLFYERRDGPGPRLWVHKVKRSLVSLGPRVTASRMVRQYVEELYEPTAERSDHLNSDAYARARVLASFKARVRHNWAAVGVDLVEGDVRAGDLGAKRVVTASIRLGALDPDDVSVQLVHGPVGPNDEILVRTVASMTPDGDAGNGAHRFRGEFACELSGRYGFTVRVVPHHTDLREPLELGCVAWAN